MFTIKNLSISWSSIKVKKFYGYREARVKHPFIELYEHDGDSLGEIFEKLAHSVNRKMDNHTAMLIDMGNDMGDHMEIAIGWDDGRVQIGYGMEE